MSKTALVQFDGLAGYFDEVLAIGDKLHAEGFQTVLLESSPYTLNSRLKSTLATANRKKNDAEREALASRFELIEPAKFSITAMIMAEPLGDSEALEVLQAAAWSATITSLSNEKPGKLNLFAAAWKAATLRLALRALRDFRLLVEDLAPDLVLVANGRYPHQKALEIAASDAGRAVRFYERGFTSRGVFFQNFPIHDRFSLQSAASKRGHGLSSQVLNETKEDWLRLRRTDRNPFYKNGKELEKFSGGDGLSVAIFPSSSDEYAVLPGWSRHAFPNQFEGFRSWLVAHAEEVKRVSIRIHPNSLGKPISYVLRELAECRKTQKWCQSVGIKTEIFSAIVPVDSYEVVREADHILVSNSTIGLEALLMDRPVTTLWDTSYDLATGIQPYLPGQIRAPADKRNSSAVGRAAQQFLAGRLSLDSPLGGTLVPVICSNSDWRARGHSFLRKVLLAAQSIYHPLAHLYVRFALRRYANAVASHAAGIVFSSAERGKKGVGWG